MKKEKKCNKKATTVMRIMTFFYPTSLYLKTYIQNLVENGLMVSEKSNLSFSYANGLGTMSRYDLDLQ